MKQPEVGDKVQFITDMDMDGWPEIREGILTNCTVDTLVVNEADLTQHELNPDLFVELQIGNMRAGLWRYAP